MQRVAFGLALQPCRLERTCVLRGVGLQLSPKRLVAGRKEQEQEQEHGTNGVYHVCRSFPSQPSFWTDPELTGASYFLPELRLLPWLSLSVSLSF